MICSTLGTKCGDVNLGLVSFVIAESAIGNIIMLGKDSRLVRLEIAEEPFAKIHKKMTSLYPRGKESQEPFRSLLPLLGRYLRGQRVDFGVDVDWDGRGDFTRRVLEETRKIPYGKVSSYGSLGKRVGYGNAARAVGQALKRNPVPLVIPCHRVIRGDGTLGGFSMVGTGLKEKLLLLEGVSLDRVRDYSFF
jgi:methylated-DNA-[protein]-cysteine S-methyltransferase